jgi:hypothetical protein
MADEMDARREMTAGGTGSRFGPPVRGAAAACLIAACATVAAILLIAGWPALQWGSVPDWVIAATAIVGVAFGLRQLQAISHSEHAALDNARRTADQARSEANSARANLLLRIDDIFEGNALANSRLAWLIRRTSWRRTYAHLSSADRDAAVQLALINDFNQLWDAMTRLERDGQLELTCGHGISVETLQREVDAYRAMVRLPDWLETIGLLVAQQLVPADDIMLLYRGVIRSTMGVVQGHLAHRRNADPNSSQHVFEHAIALHHLAERWKTPEKYEMHAHQEVQKNCQRQES